MASNPLLLSLYFILSSFFDQGFSDTVPAQLPTSGLTLTALPVDNMQCMQKLLPCQPFLKSPANPTAACCQPLKDMVTNDTECLCRVFNNPQLLQSFNVTKDDALKLPKACGANADVSKCNEAATSPISSPNGTSPPADDSKKNSTSSTSSTSSTIKITPHGNTHFGIPGFAALIIALIFSAY